MIRTFAIAMCVLVTATFAAQAQQAGPGHRIGILHVNDVAKSSSTPFFLKRLRELGYVEGRTITILRKSARGRRDRLTEMAAELVRMRVDVIVTTGASEWAAARATRTIPIVVAVAGDYVARGWAESLRQPGGNITGLSTLALGLMGKQLELLKEVAPKLSRVAVIYSPGDDGHALQIGQAREAAPALGLSLIVIPVKDVADLAGAFRRMRAERVDGLIVLRHGFLLRLRGEIAAQARNAGLPALFGHRREALAGGLMAYGADTKALWYAAADYVDQILKGANPAELPISRATKFNLTVNLKTAKALGIKMPSSILLRADEVIE